MDIRSFFGSGGMAAKASPAMVTPKAIVEKSPDTIADATSIPTRPTTSAPTADAPITPTAIEAKDQTTPTISAELEIPGDIRALIEWESGKSIPYKAVADTFEKIGATSGRLEKESLLCKLFRAVILTTPDDLDVIVYLAFNQVYPAYEGLELGIGDALLVKAVVEATGRTKQAVEAAYKTVGDLGIVALESRSKQGTLGFTAKPKALTARLVLEELRKIAQTTGGKSMDRKVGIIKKMMIACQGTEAKYLVRALQGKLRIGLAAQTVLVSLAQAFVHCMKYLPFFESIDPASDESVSMDVEERREKGTDGPVVKRRRVLSDEDDDEDGNVAAVIALPEESLDGEKETNEPMVSPSVLLQKYPDCYEPVEARKLRLGTCAMKSKKSSSSPHFKSTEQMCELAVIAVKRAFSECPNSSLIIKALLSRPLYELYQACKLTPGVPVAPMLAKPSKQVSDVLKRLEGQLFTMEYKYDGERAQVHLMDDEKSTVKIFSRNSEDNSMKYPDLMDIVRSVRLLCYVMRFI